MAENEKQEDIIKQLRMNLKEFPSKEIWDRFFTITGCDDCSELCAEWPQLQYLLTSNLLFPSSSSSQQPESAAGAPPPAAKSEEVSILVPGCGNSRLSEHLYDAGFTNITNVDLSKVIITHMMRRNVRERPRMKWRVMDMTSMQFANETFDAIVDKGGLDVLMEPKLGPRLGNLYASEVKRLLKAGGKYICVTLVESKVLGLYDHFLSGLLFTRFRYGWKVNLYIIAPGPSSGDLNQQSFMVVAEKLVSTSISQISSFLDEYSVESHGSQAHELYQALERENRIRRVYSDAFDTYKPLEDVKTNLKELKPGCRLKLALGEPGVSRFCYNSILLDAQQDSGPFFVQFLVFILPNTRNLEWIVLFSKKQWVYVENFKTARLLMKDLSPFVKQLAPGDCDGDKVPFVTTIDGMRREEIVHQITSAVSGLIVVDDVIYEKAHNPYIPGKDLIVRRLTTESLVQSKALLTREGPIGISSEVEKKKVQATSETSKKGKHKTFHSQSSGSHGDALISLPFSL
ncbi:hypothetical protein DH2020_019670 [Rehmannia glutinosa]|uniref:Methyltransferase domain-containing protein n=1 Tax=Rehmannia glutinosa TaxID=99300 RepID=A0ABR0WGS4_REHGL